MITIIKMSKIRTFGIYNKIPLNIFQVGINKNNISSHLKLINPEFNYFFFDENGKPLFIEMNTVPGLCLIEALNDDELRQKDFDALHRL